VRKLLISGLLILSCISCQEKSKNVSVEYTIELSKPMVLYGINIDGIMNTTFSQLEKDLGAAIRIDREAGVISIYRQKDFIKKSKRTAYPDSVEVEYGSIQDVAVYRRYKRLEPSLLLIIGSINENETLGNKTSIVRQLEKNLPRTAAARQVLNQITSKIIKGKERNFDVGIDFVMKGYPTATFSMGYTQYHKDEIFFKFVISKEKDPTY
jgi:hypothetical protein